MLRKNGTLSNISKHYKVTSQSNAPKSFFYSYATTKFPEVYSTLTGVCTALSPLAQDSLAQPQNLKQAALHLASLPPFIPSA